jgi:hypothetical protein
MGNDGNDEIAVMLRQLDVLELRIAAKPKVPIDSDQAGHLLSRLQAVSNLAVSNLAMEVNVSEEHFHVGGDVVGGDKVAGDKAGGNLVKQSAGGDMQGVAGANASATYTATISSISEFKSRLEEAADEVGASDALPAKEKSDVLHSIFWVVEHAEDNAPPPESEIEKQLSPLRKAAQWIRKRVADAAAGALSGLATHWAVAAIASLL